MLLGLVVPSETVNSRFDENETELGVFVLAICLKVLADGNRLLDEVPKVLRDGWAKSYPQTRRYIIAECMIKSQRRRTIIKQIQ